MHDTMTNHGVYSVICGHDEKAMQVLLENARMMYNSVPAQDRPAMKYDNIGEMYFHKLNSRIYISTYRMLRLRSQTINNLLLTETAFWKGDKVGMTVAGMTESVPMEGNIAFESTPNGVGGMFWEQVRDAKKGDSIYKLFIYPWFVNIEYTIPQDKWGLLPKKIRPVKRNLKLDDMEKNLMTRWGLTPGQIMWRRYKMMSLGDMRVNEKGIRFSRRFAQEYECSFVQSGHPVFDSSYLIPSCVYSEPDKVMRRVAGADTAEGVEDGDWNVLYISDLDTGEIIRKIRGRWKPKEFAIRIHREMMKYGGLIGVEANNTGTAVLQKLVDLWEEERAGLKEDEEMPYRIYSEKRRYGWWTGTNRKTMFVDLEDALRTGDLKLALEDENGIEELTACQYNAKMKEEAPEGMHDDCVLALAIMWQMRKFYQFYFLVSTESGVKVHTF